MGLGGWTADKNHSQLEHRGRAEEDRGARFNFNHRGEIKSRFFMQIIVKVFPFYAVCCCGKENSVKYCWNQRGIIPDGFKEMIMFYVYNLKTGDLILKTHVANKAARLTQRLNYGQPLSFDYFYQG